MQIAFGKASRAARHPKPVVFCPPVCTLNNATRAREEDLANGLALSVEIDADARSGLSLLRGLIGQPTVVVASGGEWTDPTTGEVQPKLHGHWRLSEPTRVAETHGRLKLARRLATALVGGDATNIPVVHPIRWPGSVHRKGKPKLARSIGAHDAEIDLGEALEALEVAAAARGMGLALGPNLAQADAAMRSMPSNRLCHRPGWSAWPNGSDGEAHHRERDSSEAEPAADVADERPVIRVTLELPAAVAASNRWLAERSAAMYVLGDVLATLEDSGAGLQTVPATQTRIGLELARVARFERVARVTDDGPEWREVDPPLKVAAAIADEPGGWQSPRLAGLTEVPILRPNGRIVTTPGYDRPSRLFLCGGPFAPMANDPKAALAVLVDALGEFPFVLPHHQSAAIALMLTAVNRRQLAAAPMFGISAREAGTGKGALASLAAIIATGRRAPETPWPATADEQRKVITATLIAGQPSLILDNIVSVLSGAPLCVLITAETWSDRLLGASRLVQLPASALVVATGNNLTVAGDLCRRVVPIEMDAGCESPELREFERELVPWAIENRPKLVAAALTILAAHRKAGSPLPADFKPLGSFEEWSRTVCGALVWMGKTDPRDAMAEIRANDPKRLLLTRLLVGMETLFGRQWQSVGSILDTAKTSKERAPGLAEAIEEITAKARDDNAAKIALGRWLNAEKGRVVGGLRLESQRDDHA